MSKLRKAAPPTHGRHTSRTMEFAQDVSVAIYQPTLKTNPVRSPAVAQHAKFQNPQPMTLRGKEAGLRIAYSKEDEYWAKRAQAAEMQLQLALSASGDVQIHHVRHENAHTALGKQDQERLVRLEWLVVILLGFIAMLITLVVYLSASHNPPRNTPAHFTIPILSPFTSVVEHETSIIGSKTIALFLLIVAALSYLAIRIRFWR
ncbi:hypothetical protein DXG01_002723 [Tephrocybe rancida]|nr:hypothetical protein DXG01_002723 [Tephrocybe rancida]